MKVNVLAKPILTLAFLFAIIALFAQTNFTLKGIVTDSSLNPLQGASVKLKDGKGGSTTDAKGAFSLNITQQQGALIISYVGYKTTEVPFSSTEELKVILSAEEKTQDDVIVIGYGTVKRKDLTGAVSSLSPSAYKDQPVLNTSSAMQGRVAGVQVSNSSGAPGGAIKIRVRGSNSINGNNDPLYVVDGVALGSLGLADINVYDIASIEVLQDASATAIYGARGANGVVIITTKKGQQNATTVTYNGFVSFNKPMKKYDLMNAEQYANYVNTLSPTPVYNNPDSFATHSTDWQDLIFQNKVVQNHQLAVSGGNSLARYYVSGFYIDQPGLLLNSSQRQFGAKSNLDFTISNRITAGLNLFLSRANAHNNTDIGGKGNPVTAALAWAPTEPVFDADGGYNQYGISPIWINPYLTIRERDQDFFTNKGLFNGYVKYKITDWLTLDVNAGLDMYDLRNASLTNQWINPTTQASSQSYQQSYTFQNSNVLTCHKQIQKNDITVTGLFENTSNHSSGFTAAGSGLTSLANGYNNLGLNASQSIGSNYSAWGLLSVMGRAAYSYDARYFITASIRRDGSSKFQGSNKWGNFPSFSLAWNIANENFMKGGIFSTLKLRGGYGLTGNQNIAPYSTLGLLSTVLYSYGSTTLYQGYVGGSPSLPNLKWEKTEQTNLGIDAGILNDRITLTADVYNKNTRDLLLYTTIREYDGGGTLLQNRGSVNNKGFALLLQADVIRGKDFSWNSSINFSNNKNKVTSLGGDSLQVRARSDGLINTGIQVVKPGEPLGAFYLIPWLGIYQQDNPALGYKAGDNEYQTSGTSKVGYQDQKVVGSATPRYILGFNNTFSYKGFELNIFIQGAYGFKIFNATYAGIAYPTSDVKYPTTKDALNYWTPTNTKANFPNPLSTTNQNFIESTRFLEKGDYTRVKNMSLAYNLPKSILGNYGVRVFASLQNYITFTKYNGYDPEATSTPATSDIDNGIDEGAYPSPKTITVGLNITVLNKK